MSVALAALGGQFYLQFLIQVLGCEGMAMEHFLHCAFKHYFAAQSSGSRTEVYHVVGCQHHVFVVLHDDDGVARVAQLLERVD